MEKIQKGLIWSLILSETTHVFCCVLPTVFSFVSLLAGLGVVSALPAGWVAFHDFMHEWEIPLIFLSGLILALGWGLYRISVKIDCHDNGCGHGPCHPKKSGALLVLKIATGLFAVNTLIYVALHMN